MKIGLDRDREELYDRINRRVDQMMSRRSGGRGPRVYPYRHMNSLNTVGYKELFEYVDGLCTLENAVTRIQGNTRRYCRKQLTWFKRDPHPLVSSDDATASSRILNIRPTSHENPEMDMAHHIKDVELVHPPGTRKKAADGM